jgi:superfamily I DNA/RNA helicase
MTAEWWKNTPVGMSAIGDALTWYHLRDSQDDMPTGDKVFVGTIHSVKGLEWPVVIIADMMEGLMPVKTKSEAAALEEDNVCYVAMTRARERLMCHYRLPEHQQLKPGQTPTAVSRYLVRAGLLDAVSSAASDC